MNCSIHIVHQCGSLTLLLLQLYFQNFIPKELLKERLSLSLMVAKREYFKQQIASKNPRTLSIIHYWPYTAIVTGLSFLNSSCDCILWDGGGGRERNYFTLDSWNVVLILPLIGITLAIIMSLLNIYFQLLSSYVYVYFTAAAAIAHILFLYMSTHKLPTFIFSLTLLFI